MVQEPNSLNTNAGTPRNKLFRCCGATVIFKPMRTPSIYGDLTQSSVQVLHDSLCSYVGAYSSNESRRSYSRSYLYTLTPLFLLFTKSLHFSLSTQITSTSLSFSDLALNVFLTPSSHLVQGMPLYLHTSTSNSYAPLSTTPHSYATHVRTTAL